MGTMLLAVTVCRPISPPHDGPYRQLMVENQQALRLALSVTARKLAAKLAEVDDAAGRPSWMPGEVALVDHVSDDDGDDRPQILLSIPLDINHRLRDVPMAGFDPTAGYLDQLAALVSAHEEALGVSPAEVSHLPLAERTHMVLQTYRSASGPPGAAAEERQERAASSRLLALLEAVSDEVDEPSAALEAAMEAADTFLGQAAANDPVLVLADRVEAAWSEMKAVVAGGAVTVNEADLDAFSGLLRELLTAARGHRPKPKPRPPSPDSDPAANSAG